MPCKIENEITYPFPNFNGYTVEVWEWLSNFIAHSIIGVIVIRAGIKVKELVKRATDNYLCH